MFAETKLYRLGFGPAEPEAGVGGGSIGLVAVGAVYIQICAGARLDRKARIPDGRDHGWMSRDTVDYAAGLPVGKLAEACRPVMIEVSRFWPDR